MMRLHWPRNSRTSPSSWSRIGRSPVTSRGCNGIPAAVPLCNGHPGPTGYPAPSTFARRWGPMTLMQRLERAQQRAAEAAAANGSDAPANRRRRHRRAGARRDADGITGERHRAFEWQRSLERNRARVRHRPGAHRRIVRSKECDGRHGGQGGGARAGHGPGPGRPKARAHGLRRSAGTPGAGARGPHPRSPTPSPEGGRRGVQVAARDQGWRRPEDDRTDGRSGGRAGWVRRHTRRASAPRR